MSHFLAALLIQKRDIHLPHECNMYKLLKDNYYFLCLGSLFQIDQNIERYLKVYPIYL